MLLLPRSETYILTDFTKRNTWITALIHISKKKAGQSF